MRFGSDVEDPFKSAAITVVFLTGRRKERSRRATRPYLQPFCSSS